MCSGSKAGSCEGHKLPTEAAPVTWDKKANGLSRFSPESGSVYGFTSESESSSGPLGKQNHFDSWLKELVVSFLCCGSGLHINSSAEKNPGRRL